MIMDGGVRWVYVQEEGEETAGAPELRMLGYDRFSEAMPLPDHDHGNAFEFVYMEKGKATWEVGNASYGAHAGQLFHTKPGETHRARFDNIAPSAIWWVIVEDPWDGAGWPGVSREERKHLGAALREASRVVTVGSGILEPLRRMRRALETGGPLRGLAIRQAVADICLRALHPNELQQLPDDLRRSVDRLLQDIEARPERRWTAAELAGELGVSESHLFPVFREAVGISPASYIERVRIHRACERLTGNGASVTEVAFDLGYKTSQHFATVFKRYTGCSPTEWRRKYNEESS